MKINAQFRVFVKQFVTQIRTLPIETARIIGATDRQLELLGYCNSHFRAIAPSANKAIKIKLLDTNTQFLGTKIRFACASSNSKFTISASISIAYSFIDRIQDLPQIHYFEKISQKIQLSSHFCPTISVPCPSRLESIFFRHDISAITL